MMAMRFRETDALLREAESREALVSALKGGAAAKEFRKERAALEKAAGGAKNLSEAEKVLAEANAQATKITAKAAAVAATRMRAVDDEAETANAALNDRDRQLVARTLNVNSRENALAVESNETDEANRALNDREKAADVRESALLRREAQVASREASAAVREAEIKRFDDWRATAPA